MKTKDQELKIIYRNTEDLAPYPNNPRNNDSAVEAVANSIREFGFKIPIVIDADDIIVCGHTRLKAAKSLGIEQVPCIIANDLTEDQIRAFRLADNKVGEIATWNDALLDLEIENIALDMTEFGFEFTEPEPTNIIEDEIPEVNEEKESLVQLGQIWQLGRHKLMCGDSTNRDHLDRLMGGVRS